MLTQREIANQEKATYQMQQEAQEQRIATEKTKGTADMQAELAALARSASRSKTTTRTRRRPRAAARRPTPSRPASAQADVIEAQGLAKAEGFRAQNEAIGAAGTTAVNVATVLADKKTQIVPQILVIGGGGGSLEALAATLTRFAGQPPSGVLTQPDSEQPAG